MQALLSTAGSLRHPAPVWKLLANVKLDKRAPQTKNVLLMQMRTRNTWKTAVGYFRR